MRGSRSVLPVVLLAMACVIVPLGRAVGEEGVTETEIKIGSINDTAGPVAAYGTPRVETCRALVNHVNDQGGINGRKIVYQNESDGYDPSKTILAFKKLLEVDKVFCFIASLGVVTSMAVSPEVESRKIPYLMVGGNSSKLFFPTKRYIFGAWPTYEDYMKAMVDCVANDLKMPKARLAHIFQEDETGRDSQRGLEEQVAKYPGMAIVATEGFKRGTVDVSAQVLKAREAKPDVVLLSTIFVQSAMIAKEMDKIGWRPTVVMNASSGDDRLIQLAGAAVEGAIVQKAMPSMDEDLPGVNLYKQVIKKYFPESKVNPSAWGFTAFVEMQLGLEGIKRSGRDLSRERLIDTLESFRDVDIGSIPPVTYGPDRHWGQNQSFFTKVKDGKMIKITAFRPPR